MSPASGARESSSALITPPPVCAGRPAPSRRSPPPRMNARADALRLPGASPSLRVVLDELGRAGSASPECWSAFGVVLPQFSAEALLRLALARGGRDRAVLRAVTAPETGAVTAHRNDPARRG